MKENKEIIIKINNINKKKEKKEKMNRNLIQTRIIVTRSLSNLNPIRNSINTSSSCIRKDSLSKAKKTAKEILLL